MNALALPLLFFMTSFWLDSKWVKQDVQATEWCAQHRTPTTNVLWITPKALKSDFIEYHWPGPIEYADESVRESYGLVVLETKFVKEQFERWYLLYAWECAMPRGTLIVLKDGKVIAEVRK